MVRLAVEELIERLDITIEVLKDSDIAGVDSLIEAVELARQILHHYVSPFMVQSTEDLLKSIAEIDRP